jgi:FtsH-binding integral membrane protein
LTLALTTLSETLHPAPTTRFTATATTTTATESCHDIATAFFITSARFAKLSLTATTLNERASSLTLIHIPGSTTANWDLFA